VSSTLNGTLNPFGQTTTAEQAAAKMNLTGKVIIVTGSTSGIGLETARVLFNQGAHVVIAAKDEDKMHQCETELMNARKARLKERELNLSSNGTVNMNGQLTCIKCDLSSLASIAEFVQEFQKRFTSLNILILSACKMVPPLSYTSDGFEMQYGVNHLGHFSLCMQLLTMMKETTENELNKGRIVILSSFAHEYANTVNFDDLYWKKRQYASGWSAYAETSLANILFAAHLSKLLERNGVDINVYAVDPGIVKSSLIMDEHALSRFGIWLAHPFIKSMEQGAATSVYCATSSSLEDIRYGYFSDCNITESSKATKDVALSNKLWSLSEKLTRQRYPFSVSTNI